MFFDEVSARYVCVIMCISRDLDGYGATTSKTKTIQQRWCRVKGRRKHDSRETPFFGGERTRKPFTKDNLGFTVGFRV